MKRSAYLCRFVSLGAIVAAGISFSMTARAAGPEVVAGPAADPQCFAPWTDKTKFFKWPAKKAALSHRARQRLYRQHVAHPDDPDRQGVCGPA